MALTVPALPVTPALNRRLDGRPLLLFLDIDGTLAPIASRPEGARVPDDTRQVLGDLAALSYTYVVGVSGRAAADARRVLDVEGLWVIGNHGVELGAPGADIIPRGDVVKFVDRIADAVAQSEIIARDTPGVIVEDKHWSASVHYRLADPHRITALSLQIAAVARAHGLRLTYGRKVFELRAPIDVDKGTATVELAKRLGGLTPESSIVCAGDDRTDEDAFRSLRAAHAKAVTVRVGNGAYGDQPETTAEFSLPDPEAVRDFLRSILEYRLASIDS